MHHTTPVPSTPRAALPVWLMQGLWRGALVGAATPSVGFVVFWILATVAARPLPAGTTTSSSLDGAGPGSVVVQLAALMLYAGISAAIGSPVGAIAGSAMGLSAAGADAATACRCRTGALAAVVILVWCAAASWAVLALAPDGPPERHAVVLVPFVLGLLSLWVVPLRRGSPLEVLEQQGRQRRARYPS